MRRFLVASVAALAALSATSFASAQTLRVVMHSDVKIIDPIWSGAYITRNYGYMLYDTLFAIDAKLAIKPQMVDSWKTSDDGLTWTFILRDGLEWHDGQPVTAEDCVASLKRWSARDSMGQKLASYGADYKIVDAKTFQIVLKEKFGLLLEALGKPSVVVPFMMPKRVAETDPFKQIDEMIGSGPFTLNKADWKPGEKLTFQKNKKYKPTARADVGPVGRQGGQARHGGVGLDPRRRDPDQRADQRRDRHDRKPELRPRAGDREDQGLEDQQERRLEPVRVPAELAAAAVQRSRRSGRPRPMR